MSDIWLPRSVDDVSDYADAKHERHAHGLVIINGKEVATTLQCPHCGGHFVSRKGFNVRCVKHDARVCEKPSCRTVCTDFHPESLQRREV